MMEAGTSGSASQECPAMVGCLASGVGDGELLLAPTSWVSWPWGPMDVTATVGSEVAAPATTVTQNSLGTGGAGVSTVLAGSSESIGLVALLQPALLGQLIRALAVLADQQVVES